MEKLVFVLPEPADECLIASVTTTQYLAARMVMQRDCQDVTIVCKNKQLHKFVKSGWVWAEVVSEISAEARDGADFLFEFDTKKAYEVTRAVEKPIHDAYGVQLGISLFPYPAPVLVEEWAEEPGRVLVVGERPWIDKTECEWRWYPSFIQMGGKLDIFMSMVNTEDSFDEMRRKVAEASVVVGVRSTPTLLAAVANKYVVELSPASEGHESWFKKAHNRNYRMLYGDVDNANAEFVWGVLNQMVKTTGFIEDFAEKAAVSKNV